MKVTNQKIELRKPFLLDWKKHTLYIFEPEKSKQTVNSIIKLIKNKRNLPSVPIDIVGKNKFTLTRMVDENDIQVGGHNRALAHYILGLPLKVIPCDDLSYLKQNFKGSPQIQDIRLIDDLADLRWRKEYYGGYE